MKAFRKVLWIVLAGLVACSVASAELLKNPSFEDEGDSGDLAQGWNRWGHWINRETGWTPTKDGSCLVGYHHWRIESNDNSGLWQDIYGVEAGDQLTFSVHANADLADEGSQSFESVELRIETTVNGEQSTVASKTWEADAIAQGQEWSRLFVQATAPTEAIRLVIVANPAQGATSRGGALKLDAAELNVGGRR